jgi:hypothetical protein
MTSAENAILTLFLWAPRFGTVFMSFPVDAGEDQPGMVGFTEEPYSASGLSQGEAQGAAEAPVTNGVKENAAAVYSAHRGSKAEADQKSCAVAHLVGSGSSPHALGHPPSRWLPVNRPYVFHGNEDRQNERWALPLDHEHEIRSSAPEAAAAPADGIAEAAHRQRENDLLAAEAATAQQFRRQLSEARLSGVLAIQLAMLNGRITRAEEVIEHTPRHRSYERLIDNPVYRAQRQLRGTVTVTDLQNVLELQQAIAMANARIQSCLTACLDTMQRGGQSAEDIGIAARIQQALGY